MNSNIYHRARIVFFLIIGSGALIILTLYKTQILDGYIYANKAQAQYTRPATSIFDRGSIFFRTKDGINVAAASIDRGYLVFLDPRLITDPNQVYEAISEFVKIDKNEFDKDINSDGVYVELIHRLDQKTADDISALKLTGVGVLPEAWRSYPGGSLASQTIGIIGENASSTIKGRYGLERSYDSVLTRQDISSTVNTFADLFSGFNSVFNSNKEKSGDIVTTIEPTVQAYLEKVLSDTDTQWHPDSIGGIIMDPQTGDIIALSHLPSFNPNNLTDLSNISLLSNPLVEHVYEMGSIFKPLTMATAIDTGAVTPTSTYDDVGCMVLNQKKICNYDQRARGVIPMQQILSQSLNIGATTIALKVGKENMIKYFTSFGIGSTTGIDLPNEATGIDSNLTKIGADIDIATASYGQGVAVSPVEMVRALSVLANGGYLVTPHIVNEIEYLDGTKKILNWPKSGPILKAQTVSDVDDMLVKVVDTVWAGGDDSLKHFSMGIKTGTAQIADPVYGGYYPDRYLHSFFGFFPVYNPRFVVFLYQVYPKGAEYSSQTLSVPYDSIAKFLIDYYNLPPDR